MRERRESAYSETAAEAAGERERVWRYEMRVAWDDEERM